MATALYSALHFLVDMVCAWAMFGKFIPGNDGYLSILLYNFCAFALQMPIGALLDLYISRSPKLPHFFAASGVALTIIGVFTHPVILGLGNALFHVGGGVITIREDNAHNRKGAALGIFVAPGALGLYLGRVLNITFLPVFLLMVMLTIPVFFLNERQNDAAPTESHPCPPLLIICCFLVVILRSHIGMAVQIPWKTGILFPTLGVLAVVLGKMAGGILSVRFGCKATILTSLLLAAGCFLGSGSAAPGLGALFLFNMTMPITLYLLVQKLPDKPGFSFGLLTFGLFLGFLPTYLEVGLPLSAPLLGAIGSLISLVLLLLPLRKEGSLKCSPS